MSQPRGSTLILTCNVVEGATPVRIQWLKNNNPIVNSSLIDPNRYSIDTRQSFSYFNLFDVDIDDSGNYSCVAINKHGLSIEWTLLEVKGL